MQRTQFYLLIIGYRCVDTLAKIRYSIEYILLVCLNDNLFETIVSIAFENFLPFFIITVFSHEFATGIACCLARTQSGKCRSLGDFISTRLSVHSQSLDQRFQMVATRGSFSSVLSSSRFDFIDHVYTYSVIHESYISTLTLDVIILFIYILKPALAILYVIKSYIKAVR